MRVHTHTRFCFLCVLTLLYHQCSHCHEGGSHHHHGHNHGDHDHVHSDLQISELSCAGLSDHFVHSSHGETAESEQRYYIQKLFCRYGHKDRLDFKGLQSLLLSLGLGKVRVVGLEHEDLGHDHVAHLDVLEVQEGLHSHSADQPDLHQKPHISHKTHQHSHNENEQHGSAEELPCSKTLGTGAESTTHSGSEEHDHGGYDHDHEHDHHDHDHEHDHHNHEHDHHDHDHDHEHEKDSDRKHIHRDVTDSPHTQDDHGQLEQKSSEHAQENNDLSDQNHHHHDHHHHKHPHPHLHGPDSVEQNTATPHLTPRIQPSALTEQPTTQPRRKSRPLKARAHRGRNKTSISVTQADELDTKKYDHDNSSQDHSSIQLQRSRRAVPGEDLSVKSHAHGVLHQHEECLNLTELLHQYGLSSDSLISPAQFNYLCPALLYQIDRRFCILHYHHVEAEVQDETSSVWVWMWGFVSITIISLLSLLGVVLVPILNQSCFKFLLTFLVALAVGTLSGDALLHLLPHSQDGHDHSHGGHAEEEPEELFLTKFDGVWKGLTALAGIYLLFIIEHCIGMFKHYRDQRGSLCQRKKKGEQAKIGRKLSDHKLNRRSDAEWLHLKSLTEGEGATCETGHNDTQMTELQPLDSPSKMPLSIPDSDHPYQEPVKTEEDTKPKAKSKKHGHGNGHGHGHGHSHHGHCHSDQEMKDAGIASIAWMVIMGDGMHNFSDGLAIGAAFSANITGGISTSVAVFCHELPHELGDFAVLLKAGMSVKQAIVYNVLSALMAYAGMVIGTAVGQYTHNVTSWIFAVTAGMFLYVALVDMLPEMLHGDSEEHKRCEMGHFVLQNLGMLTGFGIMLLIAIFEDQIVLDFGF
ncbi:zinc transporter ZIP10-like isoform X2 [Carassius auratus]|nr:zinc transporter ZIP10-like isoform X2 [Carassius auratus]XP_026109901.1 zinc transporter ZIP10-like isoform X2 [Carassius auratus]XP_026109902.1 zinc transporter ZIP10-like isoform X2 [Carassius auratus]XP_026109903.1 zinc transporter ZIP10-like isoform X2 [Carassius auratus]XP_026109905.1 zinc transporter ZIP10-like isoform X2 [Carassius auratus]